MLAGAALVAPGPAAGQPAGEVASDHDDVTFTEDVAAILYENCVTCHRAGEVAPMSLITYQETRPWVRSIKNKVMSGEMPPWHADASVGRFLNERRLTDAERETIVAWVDARLRFQLADLLSVRGATDGAEGRPARGVRRVS